MTRKIFLRILRILVSKIFKYMQNLHIRVGWGIDLYLLSSSAKITTLVKLCKFGPLQYQMMKEKYGTLVE